MSLHTLRQLLVHELEQLYGGEQQFAAALTPMATAAASPRLATAFKDRYRQSARHQVRLEQCFTLLAAEAKAGRNTGMAGLLDEIQTMAQDAGDRVVRDAGLIGAAQRVSHYELATYGTCAALADVLGEHATVTLLRQSFDEEQTAEARLATIARDDVYQAAMLSSAMTVALDSAG